MFDDLKLLSGKPVGNLKLVGRPMVGNPGFDGICDVGSRELARWLPERIRLSLTLDLAAERSTEL